MSTDHPDEEDEGKEDRDRPAPRQDLLVPIEERQQDDHGHEDDGRDDADRLGDDLEELVDGQEVPLRLDVLRREQRVGLRLEAGREDRGEDDQDREDGVPGDDLVEDVVREERLEPLGRLGRRRSSGPRLDVLRIRQPLLVDEQEVQGEESGEEEREHEDVDAEEASERGLA